MLVLMIVSIVSLARHGSPFILQNWAERPRGSRHIAKAIFDGISLGFLATTGKEAEWLPRVSENTKPLFLGFECTPAYIEDIHPEMFKSVLRNLLVGAMVLNGPLMLLVYCLVPSDAISGNTGVLSLLAQSAGGSWLRLLIVIDAVLVLTGGIFMGLFTVCGLIDRLAKSVPLMVLNERALTAPTSR